MSIKYLSLGAFLVSSLASHANAVNCQFFLTYSDAVDNYQTGSKVKLANHGWECLVAGWCNQGGAFAPDGWASSSAWKDLGQCDGTTGNTQNYAPRVNPYGPFRGVQGSTISFNGSTIARDDDGAIVNYLWNFGDGTISSVANPQHIYSTAGFYTVNLMVTDDDGATATGNSKVSISVPQSVACPAPIFIPGDLIEKGKVVQNGGQDFRCTSSSCSFITLDLFEPGIGNQWSTYWVSLGNCADNTDYNQYPRARITVSPGGLVNDPIQLNSSNSSDGDGTIVSYLWTFADGSTSTQASPVYTPTTEGAHSIQLTVTDNQGGTDTATTPIFITGKPNPNCWAPPYIVGNIYSENAIVQYKNKDHRCLVQAYCSFPALIFEPGTPRANGVWQELGACSATKPVDPPIPQTCANTTPNFVQGTTYQNGNEVKFGGRKFSCKVAGWCTQGGWAFSPNGTYWDMAWTDLGICN